MRPRPYAAENLAQRVEQVEHEAVASMRPRPYAAENVLFAELADQRGIASMRPRPYAAENAGDLGSLAAEALLQ